MSELVRRNRKWDAKSVRNGPGLRSCVMAPPRCATPRSPIAAQHSLGVCQKSASSGGPGPDPVKSRQMLLVKTRPVSGPGPHFPSNLRPCAPPCIRVKPLSNPRPHRPHSHLRPYRLWRARFAAGALRGPLAPGALDAPAAPAATHAPPRVGVDDDHCQNAALRGARGPVKSVKTRPSGGARGPTLSNACQIRQNAALPGARGPTLSNACQVQSQPRALPPDYVKSKAVI